MLDKAQTFAQDLWKTLVHVALLIGVPVGFLSFKYDIWAATSEVSQQMISNKISAIGIVVLLFIVLAAKYILSGLWYNVEPKWPKRLFWGLSNAVPIYLAYLFASWISNNIEFLREVLLWSALTNSIAYLPAPNYLVKMKNGDKRKGST